MVDSCPPHLSGEDVYRMLTSNFKRHYNTNRAPFGLYFHTTWFKRPEYLAAFKVPSETAMVREIAGKDFSGCISS